MEAELDEEGLPVPKCAFHPDRQPIAACVHCGLTVCEACATLDREGYRCPECPPDEGETESAVAVVAGPAARLAAVARLAGLVGLVPLIGAPVALAAVALALAAQRRLRGGPQSASAPKTTTSLLLGCLGLAGTAAVIWWLSVRR